MDPVIAQILNNEIDKAISILVDLRKRIWVLLEKEIKNQKPSVREANDLVNDAIDQTLETHDFIDHVTTSPTST
jgi:hypothetical protein